MGRIKSPYYRGKYLIAVYDLNDNFIDVFDNIDEMASRLGKTRNTIESTLTRYFAGKYETFRFFDLKTKLYLIEA